MKSFLNVKVSKVVDEFRKYLQNLGADPKLWFGEEDAEGYDSGEIVTLVSVPYYFIAKRMGLKITVCVETSLDQDHHVVVCGKAVLENADVFISDFTFEADDFERWVRETEQMWQKTLSLIKLVLE
jgi:hypothetical protein